MRAGLLMCVLSQDFPRAEPKVQRLEEIYGAVEFGIVLLGGVRLFDCRSSIKTAHETSTTCAIEWVQSTVYLEVNVVPLS